MDAITYSKQSPITLTAVFSYTDNSIIGHLHDIIHWQELSSHYMLTNQVSVCKKEHDNTRKAFILSELEKVKGDARKKKAGKRKSTSHVQCSSKNTQSWCLLVISQERVIPWRRPPSISLLIHPCPQIGTFCEKNHLKTIVYELLRNTYILIRAKIFTIFSFAKVWVSCQQNELGIYLTANFKYDKYLISHFKEIQCEELAPSRPRDLLV